ncbi:MAG: single-stranded DNA-binding protein, partial [Gemmatimonadaceae bacterium]|nr:single-stranded DNA-binding protein [Gemmatimonadaceae bacterium]
MTRDVEVRNVGTTSVGSFGIAINHTYKDKDGNKKEEVTFIDVDAWDKKAEFVSK